MSGKSKRKLGGFFVGLILLSDCIGGDNSVSGKIFVDWSAKEGESDSFQPAVKFHSWPRIGNRGLVDLDAEYYNEQDGFGLRIPSFWQGREYEFETGIDEQPVVYFSNFDFDDNDFLRDGELLVEIVKFRKRNRGDSMKYWIEERDWGLELYNDGTAGSGIEKGFDFAWRVLSFGNYPEDWQGEWFSGLLEEYYFDRLDYFLRFAALADVDNMDLLGEFEDVVETVRFDDY